MQGQKENGKASNACRICRLRKVRCSGGMPCQNCLRHDKECFYPPSQRLRQRDRDRDRDNASGRSAVDKQSRMSTCNHSANRGQATRARNKQATAYPERDTIHVNTPPDSSFDTDNILNFLGTEPPCAFNGQQSTTLSHSHSHPPSYNPANCDSLPTPQSSRGAGSIVGGTIDKEETAIYPQKVNWEHNGPISWISICSQPGLRWVADRIGNTDFNQSAKSLTFDWSRRLKFMTPRNRAVEPEPDEETAWKYCTAYFEDSYDSLGGVVHQSDFETRLRTHFKNGSSFDDGAAWYALRNTVYASGCRSLLFKNKQANFAEAQAKAWRYYENALSVFVELVFAPSGISVVQAIAAMCFYVEGVGNPALQYMMCATAARLAYAKGLHRQPAKIWNLPTSEIISRNWLFWAIYCCEKHIANRSGRPSAIDDDDISCQIPTSVLPGSNIDVAMFTYRIKHAQISSRISRQLTSVKAFQQSPAELIKTMVELTAQLEQWRKELPSSLKPGSSPNSSESAASARFLFSPYFDYAYYGSLTAINQVFAYPWISALVGTEEDNTMIRNQIVQSTDIIAEAARKMILIGKQVEITTTSPQWLVFFCPIVGTIDLFITILRNPSHPSARSDIALLDVAVGHFGHMEIVTSSDVSFPFVREVANIAYNVVRKAEEKSATRYLTMGEGLSFEEMSPILLADLDCDPLSELDQFPSGACDLDGWNSFSSLVMETSYGDKGMSYFP